MNRIEFIGNSIFIPFFLISVGMIVDIRILIEKPEALLIAGTLIAVSITGKWSAAFFTQLIFGYSSAQRQVRSEEHTSELQSLMRISYAVFCLKKKKKNIYSTTTHCHPHTQPTPEYNHRHQQNVTISCTFLCKL